MNTLLNLLIPLVKLFAPKAEAIIELPIPAKPRKRGYKLVSPVRDKIPYVTSPYGYRKLNYAGAKRSFHYGCDFRAWQDTPGFAIEDCVIIDIVRPKQGAEEGFKYSFQSRKWINLKNGAITPRVTYQGKWSGNRYVHKHINPKKSLMVGQKVTAGEEIGTYGNYGYSMGSHCHLEVWVYRAKAFGLVKLSKGRWSLVNPRVWLEKFAEIKCTGRKRQVPADSIYIHE